MFTKDDHKDIENRGITLGDIEEQLLLFKKGINFLPVIRPATSGDGILKPREDTLNDFVHLYESKSVNEKVVKFVPASGVASRMFKDLYTFLDSEVSDLPEPIAEFIKRLQDFAFYGDLKSSLEQNGLDPESLVNSGKYAQIIRRLLEKDGLNYSNLPKGLLAFHKNGESVRAAFDEQLVEGAMYCRGGDSVARIHFTVSPEHLKSFKDRLRMVQRGIEEEYVCKLEVGFSTQKQSTDTITVDPNGKPFRDINGKLVFRPGGHGALLENLAGLDADIIFIKNIDNVVPDHLKEETVRYKKALGGMLISFRGRIYDYLNILHRDTEVKEGQIEEIMTFLHEELFVIPPWGIMQWDMVDKRKYLVKKLNRPLRVCGMVRNEGEPGGGPFWVKNSDGSASLQIVESSQVNMENPLVKKLFNASTHFNPVDLACSVRNFNNSRFDLQKFLDPGTGFISSKSAGGKPVKALELPGLWNGAMADWNTVFMEVPLITFNPVKTINDLLRPEHAGG
jgi:hypothetical protein